MADREYSSYQQKVIKRFYQNRDQSDRQRLAELVADLYLATPKKLPKLWESAQEVMTRLGVPASRLAHVMSKKEATILAEVVKEIEKGALRLTPPKPESPGAPAADA